MMRIHHIGYLVKHIEKARKVFEQLGFTPDGPVVDDYLRGVNIQFMNLSGLRIELVSPNSEGSVVFNLMKTYKNTPYHICYETEDIETELCNLTGKGFFSIDQPMQAPAIEGGRVCFLMNAQIGMIELLKIEKVKVKGSSCIVVNNEERENLKRKSLEMQ